MRKIIGTLPQRPISIKLPTDFIIKTNTINYANLKLDILKEDPEPKFYWNYFIPFMDYREFNYGINARKVLTSINAGGNSIVSEAISAEIMSRMFSAKNIRTEMEIEYLFSNWKIADFTVRMFNKNVGISVTRAASYNLPFNIESADILLRKKIIGLVLARNGTSDKDSWQTSILHILAEESRIKNLLHKAYKRLPCELKDNIIILCTVTGPSDYIYKNLKKGEKEKLIEKFS
ncbi:Hypothetical protein PACV_25 [Pacmanvirus A23]|uniref:Hypothetical protein n=1 Tax=Pacmanvirus A23 TaxID=1932881 RepID=UPI000A094BE4|nr:Hypothetical protein B9W72_gp025 [Pacmanvirus A23]SIP85742.1 Hypothetical protein PACV_25 [Pacmanvirus A23]